ncbi:MAG: hypothetical protein HS116_18575 [Planctomycetes bacterium]|nr:hypothetical protein [Planctomycetota bacterium]
MNTLGDNSEPDPQAYTNHRLGGDPQLYTGSRGRIMSPVVQGGRRDPIVRANQIGFISYQDQSQTADFYEPAGSARRVYCAYETDDGDLQFAYRMFVRLARPIKVLRGWRIGAFGGIYPHNGLFAQYTGSPLTLAWNMIADAILDPDLDLSLVDWVSQDALTYTVGGSGEILSDCSFASLTRKPETLYDATPIEPGQPITGFRFSWIINGNRDADGTDAADLHIHASYRGDFTPLANGEISETWFFALDGE